MIAEGRMAKRNQTRWCFFFCFFIVLLLSFGCQISPRRSTGSISPTPTPTPGTAGQLYVASGNSILRFADAETISGAVAPTATITASQLVRPQRLLVDTQNDRLFVANRGAGSILVFENASARNGNIAPDRIISGANTVLTSPVDLAFDPVANQLYVADGTRILVFGNASAANGNITPLRNINVGANIGSILLDTTNNILYVSDPADNVIDVLGSASQQDVVAVPSAIIAGPDTKLSGPTGLALDAAGRLIVANSVAPTSITIYPSASTANGDVLPAASISGASTKLTSPTQLILNRNVSNGELYVIDNSTGSVLVYGGLNAANGNLAPARVITSTALAANALGGFALDPTR
jgi:DNA-binding beta-propeller fold protein YncE